MTFVLLVIFTAIFSVSDAPLDELAIYKTSDDFWQHAFADAGISDNIEGKWIGGLAASYNIPLFNSAERQRLKHRNSDSAKSFAGKWEVEDFNTFRANMEDIDSGIVDVHICYNHECFIEENECNTYRCGMIGSTDRSLNVCPAFVWHTQIGIWFLLKADGNERCLQIFDEINSISNIRETSDISEKHNLYNKASISYEKCKQKNIGTKSKNGQKHPVSYCLSASIDEISLTTKPHDKTTWISAKFHTGNSNL